MIASAVLYLVGALITAAGPTFVIMMIGRVVFGIGIGLVFILIIFLSFGFTVKEFMILAMLIDSICEYSQITIFTYTVIPSPTRSSCPLLITFICT